MRKEKKNPIKNYLTNKKPQNHLSIDLTTKIIKKSAKQSTKSKENEKTPLITSFTNVQFSTIEPKKYHNNRNSNNKTNILRKLDMSEEMLTTISTKKKHHINNKGYSTINFDFTTHYEVMKEYEQKRLEKIIKMKEYLENIEINKLKKKQDINRSSKKLINNKKNNENIYQKLKEEEKKIEEKKKLLLEKIKKDKLKRKTEKGKTPTPKYKFRKVGIDKKFNKYYTNMIEKDKINKEKFQRFTKVVKDIEMKECVFQPNLTEFNGNKFKTLNSNELIHRLYDEQVKKRLERQKNLEKKYRLTFKPELNNASMELTKKCKEKIDKKINSGKTRNRNVLYLIEKKLNNSMHKRISRNYKLNLEEKNSKINTAHKNSENNRTVVNNYVDEIKEQIINNNNINKSTERENDIDEQIKENIEEKEIKDN